MVRTGMDKRVRKRVTCPICNKDFVHVPRHLRQIHAFDAEDSVHYREQLGLFKTPHAACPVADCGAVVGRLDQHLRRFHRMHTESVRLFMQIQRVQVRSNVSHFWRQILLRAPVGNSSVKQNFFQKQNCRFC